MMGGGVCWLDYDRDGWLDLYVVNGYAESDIPDVRIRSRSAASRLFRNVKGRFEDVTASTGAGLARARQRVRRRRPRRERHDRPVRDDGGVRRANATPTTRCSGTTATGRSRRAPGAPGSERTAGTRAPPSPT